MTEINKEYVSKYSKKNVVNETKEVNENIVNNKDKFKNKDLSDIKNKFPKHIVELAVIVKHNAEIRRFTSLGILNYLLQKGEIKGKNRYVTFKWNKFVVKNNGLIREFSYTEPFFIKCLIASFTSFSASAQNIINTFCKEEIKQELSDITTNEEVEEIVKTTEQYQESNNDSKNNKVEETKENKE